MENHHSCYGISSTKKCLTKKANLHRICTDRILAPESIHNFFNNRTENINFILVDKEASLLRRTVSQAPLLEMIDVAISSAPRGFD